MMETISSSAFIWQINEHDREPHPELGTRLSNREGGDGGSPTGAYSFAQGGMSCALLRTCLHH